MAHRHTRSRRALRSKSCRLGAVGAHVFLIGIVRGSLHCRLEPTRAYNLDPFCDSNTLRRDVGGELASLPYPDLRGPLRSRFVVQLMRNTRRRCCGFLLHGFNYDTRLEPSYWYHFREGKSCLGKLETAVIIAGRLPGASMDKFGRSRIDGEVRGVDELTHMLLSKQKCAGIVHRDVVW